HQGTGFTPLAFTAEKDGEAYLCRCKQTDNAPYCDGSHATIPEDKIGKAFSLNESDETESLPEPTSEEPTVGFIHQLARGGLAKLGPHEEIEAMGVPRAKLPDWNDIQFMVAQLAARPLMEEVPV